MVKNNEKNEKNFQLLTAGERDLFRQLEIACEGLVLVSEIDAEVTPYVGPIAAAGEQIAEVVRHAASIPMSELIIASELSEFFAPLTRTHDWHQERHRVRAKKFLDLHKLIEENLSETRVVRFGETRSTIYVVGRSEGGRIIGVETRSLQT